MVGDQVFFKQRKADVLTPLFDPRSCSVIGVKGSMITMKRGREIKSRNSSHCKLIKQARVDKYDAVDSDQEIHSFSAKKKLKQEPGKICVCNPTTSA